MIENKLFPAKLQDNSSEPNLIFFFFFNKTVMFLHPGFYTTLPAAKSYA